MNVETAHPVVAAYLAQLDAATAAAGLGGGRRAELRAEIRAHVDDALAGVPQITEAAVADVLDRLGPVEDIVSAETGTQSPKAAPAPPAAPPAAQAVAQAVAPPGAPSWGTTEWVAVGLLTIGAVLLPVIGPIAGAVLAWTSRLWSRGAKVLVTALALVPTALIVVGGLFLVAFSSPMVEVSPTAPVSTVETAEVAPSP
jgi:hypothetical protein